MKQDGQERRHRDLRCRTFGQKLREGKIPALQITRGPAGAKAPSRTQWFGGSAEQPVRLKLSLGEWAEVWEPAGHPAGGICGVLMTFILRRETIEGFLRRVTFLNDPSPRV